MAVLEIVKHPDIILREKSTEIETFDKSLKEISRNMIDTMHAAKGIGLAGVQVAYTKRILVLDVGGMKIGDDEDSQERTESNPEVYINPEILEFRGETEYEEGCLSIPGIYGLVDRSEEIDIRYQDINGDTYEESVDGLKAIVLQHEIDHLNGVLFIDHLSPMKRSMLLAKYKKLQLEAAED